ncbi:MAG: hypothetical protein KBF74_04065 [Ferruginibacter sp.]|nr:hypothetical protein [Ferruginibacter sp.]
MKMSTEDMALYSGEQEKKDQLNEDMVINSVERQSPKAVFGTLDLWKMQKKHKTLGSSIRWQPL